MLSYREFVAEMSMLDEMPLPVEWDKNLFKMPGRYTTKDFVQALLYARERSTYIAKGSSRAVFQIEYEGRPTILKMAMNKAGLDQNERECDIMFDGVMGQSPVIVPGIDHDEENDQPLWIHQEFAKKVTPRSLRNWPGTPTTQS